MIEGMPASSSIAMPIGRRSHCGQSSVRKIAIPRPTGMAISMAMKEVTSVPYIGPSAPSTGGSAENEQHRNRADTGDPVEGDVAELEGAERLGAIVGSGGLDYIALNGHVCHA